MNPALTLPTPSFAASLFARVADACFPSAPSQSAALDATLRTARPEGVRFRSRDGRAHVDACLLRAPRAESAVVIVVGQVGCWGSDARTPGRNLHVRTLAQALRARGLTVLVARMRGHGDAERHDVLGAVDYLLGQGYRAGNIGVLGASRGGYAALLAAAEEPAVCAVVADSPRGAGEPAAQTQPPGLQRLLVRVLGRLLSGVDIGHRPVLAQLCALRDRKVLIVHGRGDQVVSTEASEALAKTCAAELWLTASRGHAATLHEALPLYITRVVDFFSQHLLAPRSEPALLPGIAALHGEAVA